MLGSIVGCPPTQCLLVCDAVDTAFCCQEGARLVNGVPVAATGVLQIGKIAAEVNLSPMLLHVMLWLMVLSIRWRHMQQLLH
jgi:hypothetical protein